MKGRHLPHVDPQHGQHDTEGPTVQHLGHYHDRAELEPDSCMCPVPVVGADLDLHAYGCPLRNHWHSIGEPCTVGCER